ncbi:MAG TPA: class I SAM-dependent methyltransferase [Terriglobales bacterium]|nr:class I SAM-dependent methyltransferase [Terriglobales bacterium]
MSDQAQPSIRKTVAVWWNGVRARNSLLSSFHQFAAKVWEFVRDSTAERRKQRYGDADYDWEQRVNTTSATVGWRDRLLGQFLSPYQPTEPKLFHKMLGAMAIDFSRFTFIDIGSGKGRTLLMAADYPFQRVMGVEILPALHAAAEANIASYRAASQKCFKIESRCQDARTFEFPPGPILLYLFNPLPEAGLVEMLGTLHRALASQPREAYVLYHNPELERVFACPPWRKLRGTHQYSLFTHLSLK